MKYRVAAVRLRGILDSRGRPTLEAELRLGRGAVGRGSAPVAIAPGRREKPVGRVPPLGPMPVPCELVGRAFASAQDFDATLAAGLEAHRLGADATLALSLAFWRAAAAGCGLPLQRYLGRPTGIAPRLPRLLVNVFSGGIHGTVTTVPFQQIMLAPRRGGLVEDIEAARAVYDAVERRWLRRARHSASSGLLVEDVPHETLLVELRRQIVQLGFSPQEMPLAVDLAAEHLRTPDGRYRFEGRTLSGADLLDVLVSLVRTHHVVFLEDPFDLSDLALWRELTTRVTGAACVVGDDLFATNAAYIVPGVATGIVLKMSQIGTVSGTIAAARTARAAGLALCVSHRSGETEDTGMCDLAVALGAEYVKVGGPRRGDRVAKYNQLLRLLEDVTEPNRPRALRAVRQGGSPLA